MTDRPAALDPALVERACELRNRLVWGHPVTVIDPERRWMERFLAGLDQIRSEMAQAEDHLR